MMVYEKLIEQNENINKILKETLADGEARICVYIISLKTEDPQGYHPTELLR